MADLRGLLAVAAALLLGSPLAADPEAANGAMAAAAQAASRGDGIAAEAELRKAMAAGASRSAVAARMGEAWLLQGNPRQAREWLAAGQFDAGEAALGWRMTGRLLRLEGKLPEAGQAFDRALKLAPNDPLLWVDIARLRYLGHEHLQAIDAADRAVAAGPEEPRALELRAQLVRDSAGPVAALPWFERGLAAAPDDLSLLLGYAATLGEAGRAGDMLAVARKINAIDPRQPWPFYLQALIAARAGQTELARSLLARTGNRLSEVPAAMLLQGALELEAGNNALAVDILERFDQRQPANPHGQLLFARALLAVGDHTQLRQRFGVLAARPDASPYLLTLLGRSYEQTGDRATAAALLDRAAAATTPELLPIAEADPALVLAARWRDAANDPGSVVPYVRKLLASGDRAGASRVVAEFRAARPGSLEALVLSGDVALAARDFAGAFAAYDRAALIRYPDWLLLRGTEALDQAGRGQQASALARRYLLAVPDSLLAARLSAASAAFAGDWPQARDLLVHVSQRGGGRDVRVLADLSLAQLRSGDRAGALATAEAAVRLQRASPVAAQARGMALAALGRDRQAASALLAKAQRIGGDNALLREARGQVAAR